MFSDRTRNFKTFLLLELFYIPSNNRATRARSYEKPEFNMGEIITV